MTGHTPSLHNRCPDGPEAIRLQSSLDQSSHNWIVCVHCDHRIEGQALGAGILHRMIAPVTVEHVVASDVVGDPS